MVRISTRSTWRKAEAAVIVFVMSHDGGPARARARVSTTSNIFIYLRQSGCRSTHPRRRTSWSTFCTCDRQTNRIVPNLSGRRSTNPRGNGYLSSSTLHMRQTDEWNNFYPIRLAVAQHTRPKDLSASHRALTFAFANHDHDGFRHRIHA